MTDAPKNPFRYGPTRFELKVWLALGLLALSLPAIAIWARGMPGSIVAIEVLILPLAVGGYLTGRSIKRLIRREHP
jgi:hypothetical protein